MVNGLIEKAQLDLSYEIAVNQEEKRITVELFGEDEGALKSKEGLLLDSIQLFLSRVVQHRYPDEKFVVNIDSDGFRQESNEALVELAEKLKTIALTKRKSVYFRALPPKERKIVHQYLAEDGRVKSHSVGEGLYKKIKIYPAKGSEGEPSSNEESSSTPST
jgi:spoIIIJ-associated protein